jgi:hypothetical protein
VIILFKRWWRNLPLYIRIPIHQMLKPFGISFCITYAGKYLERHQQNNFVGNFLDLKIEYVKSTEERKNEITSQFLKIIDTLVFKNGVRKTNYSKRQTKILLSIIKNNKLDIKKDTINVLDLPSSIGLASADFYTVLNKHFSIKKYVLADLYHEILFDPDRNCVFDKAGNLLQVKLNENYFSIYRPHISGNEFTIFTHLFLFPLNFISFYFKKKFKLKESKSLKSILLLHPEIECKVKEGIFYLLTIDVFAKIIGSYDLILSFNLLQRNYFPASMIKKGILNLGNSLNDNGILVVGNTELYSVYRKINNNIKLIENNGKF